MTDPKVAPFGTWKSPITSDLIASQSIRLGTVTCDGEDIYWLEGRPSEKGRYVLVRRTPQGEVREVTPPPFNVRSRVHEYGGGAFAVVEGTVYFSHDGDQRLYQQTLGSDPQPITPAGKQRYAELVLDKTRNRLVCVCEDHTHADPEPENYIASVDLASSQVQKLVSGSDFYASPVLSPDGSQLAWIEWNHPNMPWDATRLWVASVQADGSLGEAECIVGGTQESVCHLQWSPDGQLYFVSDRTNWWNLYRRNPTGDIEPLWEMAAEFAYPHWVFGLSLYAFTSSQRLICAYTQQGRWYLASLDTQAKHLQTIDIPYTEIASIHANADRAVFIAGSATEPTAAVQLDLGTGEIEVLKRSNSLEIDRGYLSVPEAIAFPTEDNQTAYAWFYPPQNQDYQAPAGELPPLIVKSHGGPTAQATPTFNLKIQYWTSRGFAYLDVNYGGSTGYGRDYRQRLRDRWGIVDVNDCANGAKFLAQQGKVDGDRLIITGSSAGGYTTLAALTFSDVFKAGASYYGVSDLEILATETHKFEARYLDSLVGKYPEQKEIYEARSPIHHLDRLSCPVIFFQGLEDRVVPPNQAQRMVEALKRKGIPVAYVPFAGEQHGFRQAESIKRALEAELYFYSRVFGFEPADAIEPVEILNL